jgi:hypothetical protein
MTGKETCHTERGGTAHPKGETTMTTMTEQEIYDAVVARLTAMGEPKKTVAERAKFMINNWSWFSDNSMDERGHETCRDWLDAELVRLFDAHLRVT